MVPPPSSPGRGRRLPQAARREQLLDVAEALFLDRGFAAVTMEDVASAAGVSRPIPYNHFGSKEGVYVACVARARAAYRRDLLAAVDGVVDPLEQLRAGADFSFAVLERSPARWRLLFASTTLLPGEHSAELERLRFESLDLVTELFRAAAGPDVPGPRLEALAHANSGVIAHLGHWWLAHPEVPRAEVVEHYLAFVVDGVRPYVEAPAREAGTSRADSLAPRSYTS